MTLAPHRSTDLRCAQRELQHGTACSTGLAAVPVVHRVPLLWLDWSGARVGSIDALKLGDYDRERRRVRLRAAVSKTRRALWVDLPDEVADALEPLGHDPCARLFAGSGSDALRTAIAKACAALAIPPFSPHDLRQRRISLLHRQGRSWAEIGAFVGQRSLRVTADVYTHVLLDDREVDYRRMLALSASVSGDLTRCVPPCVPEREKVLRCRLL